MNTKCSTAPRGHRKNSPHRKLSLSVVSMLAIAGCLAGAPSENILEINVTAKPDRVNGQPVIAVNPTRPDNLVFVSTNHLPVSTSDLSGLQCFAAHSEDGGKTWTEVSWPYGDRPSCGDPYLAVDSAGTFFTAFNRLCGQDAECPPGPGQVGVSISKDGGHTWSTPIDTSVPRSVTPRLRVDTATDNIFVVGGLGRGDDPIAVTASTDQGLTWGPAHPLPPQAFGNQIAVHDGILATATSLQVVDGRRIEATEIKFWVSTDMGKTFEPHSVTDNKGTPVVPPEGNLVPNGQTTNSEILAMTDPIPLVSADPTSTGRFALMVPRGDDMEIYITDNAGKDWRGPATIHALNAAKPWIEFGTNGALGVMWRTFTDGVMDAYATISFDSGETFSQPLKVNRETAPYTQIQAGGDEWSRILLDGEYVYVSWSDSRGGDQIDGIMARLPLTLFREGSQ